MLKDKEKLKTKSGVKNKKVNSASLNKSALKNSSQVFSDTGLQGKKAKVLKLYMEGLDVNSIATRLKRSKKTIYNAIASIREKIKLLIE